MDIKEGGVDSMTKRSVKEIKQEIEECEDAVKALYGKRYMLDDVNKIINHLHNLYLELNRAKQRDWIERSKL